MSKGLIISGFAGIGKTTLAQNYPSVIDLESSDFKWIYSDEATEGMDKEQRKGTTQRTQNPLWPLNYVKEIITQSQTHDIVLISQDKDMRDCLRENDCEYYACFPTKECKEDFIHRYIARGNPQAFISLVTINFDNWVDALESEDKKIIMQPGEFLEDTLIRYGLINPTLKNNDNAKKHS